MSLGVLLGCCLAFDVLMIVAALTGGTPWLWLGLAVAVGTQVPLATTFPRTLQRYLSRRS